MMFFLAHGYRVIAHDRRGHGRSTQTATGNEMDTYAADVAELAAALDLRDAVHIGHSTGGGEVARYVARAEAGSRRQGGADRRGAADHGEDRTRTPAACRSRCSTASARRSSPTAPQFYLRCAVGPFYGFNRPGAKVSQGVIHNWWRQGMMGGAKAHYDCIKAFSETDFTEDLKAIDVPVLVMHGDDDQIVPYRRLGAALGEAAEERHAQDLQGLPARHVHDASRRHQPGPAGVRQGLIRPGDALRPIGHRGPTSSTAVADPARLLHHRRSSAGRVRHPAIAHRIVPLRPTAVRRTA